MNKETLRHIRIKVSTKPLSSGGSNFETNVLIKTSNSKLEFKPTTGYALFCGVFTIPTLVFLYLGINEYLKTNNFSFLLDNLFMLIFVFIFTSASFYLTYTFFKPIVFDKSINRFYKGFYKDKTKNAKNNVSLSNIIALQIIGETVKGKNNNYNSFELNLVLDDASRLNIIDHGNLKGVIQDAESLSNFLNVPIWHAESNKT